MGTNFYLRRTEPRLVYDEFHIAKTSAGWLPSFEAYTPYSVDDPRPSVHGIYDIERLVRGGGFGIVDEEGDEYTWEGFVERVLKFGDDVNYRSHEGGFCSVYRDLDGFEFLCQPFS